MIPASLNLGPVPLDSLVYLFIGTMSGVPCVFVVSAYLSIFMAMTCYRERGASCTYTVYTEYY